MIEMVCMGNVLLFGFSILCCYVEGNSQNMDYPLVINTWPWPNATMTSWKVLEANGTMLDALVQGLAVVEADRSVTSVGWGGSPSENGETALDAMVMDGVTHNTGSVGSMKRVKNAAAVARFVMERTEHTLLVGEDATSFAKQMGFKEEDLHSEESIAQWEKWKKNNCQPNFWKNVYPDPKKHCGPYEPTDFPESSAKSIVEFDENNHDTVGMVILDGKQNFVVGTSTNGATFKITGRVGDSPIAGAGAYVDNDFGGAAATGDGDVMMRFLPTYQTVENMRHGMEPSAAAEAALRRIVKYHKKFEGAIVAVNKKGEYGAASYGWDTFEYSVINKKLGEVQIIPVKPFTM